MFSFLRHPYNCWRQNTQEQRARYQTLQAHLKERNGCFVEAGANDGKTQSNTLGLERWAGWHGLLIEPIPALARACRINRPRCLVENCALVPLNYADTEIEMYDCNLMSVIRGSLPPAEEERHLRQGEGYQGIQARPVRVPARPLSALLDEHGFSRIDLLCLDTEGYELQCLHGVDWQRHRPKHLLIEAGGRDEVSALLSPLYQITATIGDDTLWRLK